MVDDYLEVIEKGIVKKNTRILERNLVFYNPYEITNQGTLPKGYHHFFIKKMIKAHDGRYYTQCVEMPKSRFSDKYGKEFGELEVANGLYTFLILFSTDKVIFCGLEGDLLGHMSISRAHSICYAGELFLSEGRLVWWSNGSGHYKPSDQLIRTNIHPELRAVLPMHLFKNYG